MGLVQVIAVGVALVMLMANAIKYMMASTSEKAEIKKHAIVYVVGAILIFAAVGMVELIKNFMEAL